MNAETRAKETPEQRARDITALMVKKLPGCEIALVMEDQLVCANLIAQALRQAENDKLEQAARLCDGVTEELKPGRRQSHASPYFAALIRSLKSKH